MTAIIPTIRVKNLHKTFLDPSGPKQVLQGISLTIKAGEIVGLFGPSGCGKSTLLRIISGVLDYDDGEVLVMGRSPREQRGKVSYVPQDGQLLDWKNLWNNTLLGWSIVDGNRSNKDATLRRAGELFNKFKLTNRIRPVNPSFAVELPA